MKNKRSKLFLIASTAWLILSVVVAALSTFWTKKVDKAVADVNEEIKMSLQYAQVTDEDEFNKVEGTDFVKFGAYFTRDLDGDGVAEKLLGSCRELNQTDTLFMDLNVLSNGYLKDGKVTISATNFKYSMNMIKDSVLAENYINNDVKEIKLNDVQAGTQKLILGNIVSNINNNINNYTGEATITLTGTHVNSDTNEETMLSKTIKVNVDWHGYISAWVNPNVYKYDFTSLPGSTINFDINVRETKNELLLKKNEVTAIIPELNEYAPIDVKVTNNNVEYEYNNETRELRIVRTSTVDEDGKVTNTLPSNNTYKLEVTYPQDAINVIDNYTVITALVSTYYEGYNNNNEHGEFENPCVSNTATGTVRLIFDRYPASAYNFFVNIQDKKYVSSPYNGNVVSKQDILNLYDSDEEITSKEYTIRWQAVRGPAGDVSSMVMMEPDTEDYADKWDSKIMEDYTTNVGVYFSNVTQMLGDDGEISIYNNETNELIKTFVKDEWEQYTKSNPYRYDEKVKHIRVETSSAAKSTELYVYNIKELDLKKVVEDFTKDEIKAINFVYSYIKGICNFANDQAPGETKNIDFARFISDKSYATLSLQTARFLTQETASNQNMYINAKAARFGDAKWKDGIFLVEVPEEIINMQINSVQTNNSNVNIVAYDLYKKDNKYFLKILTENENEEEFTITVNCNITPNPSIPTETRSFKLYSYNKFCKDYQNITQDAYDINGNNNVEEEIGVYSTNVNFVSPTSIITLETVSDYNDNDEITIAPNIALVNKDTRQATINILASNNYPYMTTDTKILGKIPFAGNKYTVTEKDMHSQFSCTMAEGGISLPADVAEKAKVYYSENENPTVDLGNEENGWKQEVEDFSKIKTYLVDLGDYEMQVGKELKFSYIVNLPNNVSFNLTAFSSHALYYSLKTEGGKLSLATEANKVGVRVIKKFTLDLTKYKKNSSLAIPSVTYTLKYTEPDDENPEILKEVTRILTTDNEGKISLGNLYAEKTYKLKEISVPDTCEKNEEEIEFTVNADNTITMVSENNSSLKNAITYSNDIVKIDLEDEVKYDVDIIKTKIGSNIPIDNVRFKLQDEDGNKQFVNTVNGTAKIEGLSLNKQYTLQEASTPGNVAKKEGTLIFKLVRNNAGEITLQTISNTLASSNPVVEDLANKLTPSVKINVEDEIRYSLDLTKQNKADGSKLQGVKFKLKGKGFSTNGATLVTSSSGKITASSLYVGEEYTLEETNAEGYYLNPEKDNTITFKVERIGGSLQITKWQKGEGVDEVGEKTFVESNQNLDATLNVVLQNEKIPTYSLNIVKENEEGEKLAGAQFKLTSEDTGKIYSLETNEQGSITFENLYEFIEEKSFVTGKYTLEEIFAPEGYTINKAKLEFKAIRNAEGKVEIEILSGDDLIKETEGVKAIESDENRISITVVDNSIFKLTKKTEEGVLLPNAKFKITDLQGNLVTGADGNIVGAPDGIIETNEKGELSANLLEGLYKAVEVEAPEKYDLPENEEERTYYFGIGASQPETTKFALTWSKTVSSNGSTVLKDVIKDNDGNFIAVGSFNGDCNINGSLVSCKGYKDGLVIKFDKDGKVIWYKTIAGEGLDEFKAITKDPTGGYIIAGLTDSDNLYYANSETSIASANFGLTDGIFVKINDDGNFVYSKVLGGVGIDKINGIAANQTGDIAVVGSYLSSDMYLDGDKNDATSTIINSRKNGTEISPVDKKNAFISVYNNNGEYIWSQNIAGSTGNTSAEAWASSVTATNSGFAITCNINGTVYFDTAKTTSVAASNADGVLVHYTNGGQTINTQKIAGSNNDELYDVIQDVDGNIIAVGSFSSSVTLGSNTYTSKGEFDSIIAKFSQNLEFISAKSFGGTLDDSISSVYETADKGLLLGGWNYSSSIDLDGDGTSDITQNSGSSDGFVIKLDSNMDLENWCYVKGNSYDDIHSVAQTNDGEYIAVGAFDSTTITSEDAPNFASNTGYYDGLIAKFGKKVVDPLVNEVQELEVTNKIKRFNITTEIAQNSDGERAGGAVTGEAIEGEENKKLVETVKYGEANTQNIVITPEASYNVASIMVNGEKYSYVPDSERKVTIEAGKFENITEDINIVVIFEKNVKQIIVHHYIKDVDGTYTTRKVADDETVVGKQDSEYITSPKMELEDYVLEKDENENYVIPENASGKFKEENEDVTYYYELKKYNLEVNHYLDGTKTKLTESTKEEHVKGFEYQTMQSNIVLEDYEFVYVDGEEQGTLNEDTVVDYYYKKKEYNITTQVVPNSETGLLGGTITGEYNTTYKEEDSIEYVETVKKNENGTKEIVITPDFGFKVKEVILESTSEEGEKVSKELFGENAENVQEVTVHEGENGILTLSSIANVIENKHIKVQFEGIENAVKVHQYLRENGEYTTKQVAADEDITITANMQDLVKPKDNLQYLHIAKNSNGENIPASVSINPDTQVIEFTYYYDVNDVKLTIEHYNADTNEKFVEDEIITITPNVLQDENGYYTVAETQQYVLQNNENYKNISTDKYLVSIAGSVQQEFNIGDTLNYTLEYNTDSEIKYYYKEKGNYEFIVNYYYDGVIDEEKTETKPVRTGDVISEYTDNNKTGYRLEKAKINNNSGEEVDLPYLVKDDMNKIILNVYYVKDTFSYKVKYFYNGVEDTSKQKNLSAEYNSEISSYPDENKDGFMLQYAKALNVNSEEIELPLTITENVSTNIINVYYSKARSFTFSKKWNNLPETELNNYRSTFILKKTVNGNTTDYTDINGNTLTRTITGNGEAEFENIIAYDKTNKVDYSVEEIKVEKTTDGGNSWQEISSEEYKTLNIKHGTLADNVKVGDYINYNPASGNGSGLSFTSSRAKSGTSISGTFYSYNLNTWRVLSIEDGQIQIIPVQPTSQKVTINGASGYINAEDMLNEISSIYGKGNGAVSARSLTVEDLEQYFKFNKENFENSNSSTGLYGGTKEYSSGSFIVDNQVVSGPQTMTQTSYYYEARYNNYIESENEAASKVYNMLFKDIDTTSNGYWFATRGVDLQSSNCRFDVLCGNGGYVGRSHIYTSNGSASSAAFKVMPVVTLNANLDGEKNASGVWQLELNSENNVVENTLITNYKVKKVWNINNPNNYKSTFTLKKTIDGVTTNAQDEDGEIISQTIIGNGNVIFAGLNKYEDGKEVTYSVEETKIEKTEDNWQTSQEIDRNSFYITHKTSSEYDDIIVNSENNKFGLDINVTEDTEEMPLKDVSFTISIKDEAGAELTEENKIYTTGTNGNLLEIASELPIEAANKKYTVTITQANEKEGYYTLEAPVTFEVTSKLDDNGTSFVLVPENKAVTNTKGVEVEENYILVKLQYNYKAEYEVHYFYDGVENEEAKDMINAKVGDIVETYTAKPEGMVLEKAKAFNEEKEEVDMPLTVRKDKRTNIINVYYRTQYKITTKINKHDEKYTNKVETNVLGGTISGSNENPYEKVFKGDTSTKQIKMIPNEGYEIASVKINGVEKIEELAEKINATDGSLTLDKFTDMDEDKEIEVDFRKKTKVTVKYLEKETNNVLSTEQEISGVEGKEFETQRAMVVDYKPATVQAIDKQGNTVNAEITGDIEEDVIKEVNAQIKIDENGKKYAQGTMFADEITIIYWYEKIPSGVWVRYIEIDEIGKQNKEKSEIKDVEKVEFTSGSKEVTRKEFEGYISVDCPNNMLPEEENIKVMKANENETSVNYVADRTVEVWFFYEQEHKITTEVVKTKEIIGGEEAYVEHGTISKAYKLDEHGNITNEEAEYYEKVLHRGNNKKTIEIRPAVDYRIKEVTINGVKQDISNLVKSDESATLPSGFIKDIKEDTVVKVEFEKIPAKVIVKYVDIETNEEIKISKEINGLVRDSYKVEREEIDGYITAGEEPTNSEGTMTKENITVTYYYERKRTITTEVKPHMETTKNGNEIKVKGGEISGEDMDVFEYVIKGKDSTKLIKIVPDEGYEISKVTINGEEIKLIDFLKTDGTIELETFKNVQENKHIVAEYRRIKGKVIVKYLEDETEEKLAEDEVIEGYLGEEYTAISKSIEGYKLVETKLPKTAGTMTKDDIIVKYYYKKISTSTKEDNKQEESKPEGSKQQEGSRQQEESKQGESVQEDNNQQNIGNNTSNNDNNNYRHNDNNNLIQIKSPKTGDFISIYIVLIIAVLINGVVSAVIVCIKKKR